jgi:hypothetical protein
MKSFINLGVLVILIFGLNAIACKNSENTTKSNTEIIILKSFKTPIIGGAGKGGMKIVLFIQKEELIQLDSIVYNGKSGEVNELKNAADGVWAESYFYDENKRVRGKGLVEYKAEGNSCELYYTVNDSVKSILVPKLELKQDDTLWK